ncbi:hypothetical protein [Streptomyces albidoflavus]|uniref:hypothetical protein n=1 Tax=Streptomyces albidoflavus TaxID=1886 RepID=UPI00340B87D6
MLILADGWASGEAWDERLRMALVAAGADPQDLFADRFPPEDVDPADDDDRDLDYSAVDWQVDTSVDDWALLQEALDQTRVSVTEKDAADEPPDDVPEVPDVDFDREWL